MKLIFHIPFIIFTLILVCESPESYSDDLKVRVYDFRGQSITDSHIDLKNYKETHEISFSTFDPNFPDLGRALYKGIQLKRILSDAPYKVNMGNTQITLLAKDQYLLSAKTGALKGIIGYELNSNPIPLRYGGPLKMIYRKFPSQEASIWYLKSIIIGSIENPILHISTPQSTMGYPINDLKSFNCTIEEIPCLFPRGYRAISYEKKTTKARYVSLKNVLSITNSNFSKIKFESFADLDFIVEDEKHISNAYIIFQLDDRNIPIEWGGPFMIAFKNEQNEFDLDREPYFYIHSICLKI